MKVEVLRQVMISGESVKAGSLREVSYQEALLLIAMGKAQEASEAPEPVVCPAVKPSTRKPRSKE